jgi:tetratricopeptide (TPR) repeat protein
VLLERLLAMDSGDERLLERLEEYEAIIAEARGSEDPVAQRQLAEALLQKGATLVELGRYRDSLSIWDEVWLRYTSGDLGERAQLGLAALLAKARVLLKLGEPAAAIDLADRLQSECAAHEQSDRIRRVRLRALQLKWNAVWELDPAQTAIVDAEIVDVFGDDDDPQFREEVMFALVHQSAVLLREGRVEDALSISRAIVERIHNEPRDALTTAARMAVDHSRHLTLVGQSSLISIVGVVAFVLANATHELLRSLTRLIPEPGNETRGGAKRGIKGFVGTLGRSAIPESVVLRRQRFKQAILVDRAVIDRISHDADPELVAFAAKARILAAMSEIALGHPRAGYRALSGMADTGQLGVIQAFQSLAQDESRGSSLPNRLGEQAFLAFRAQALGAGDKEIEQIAYEDSLKARQHRDDPAIVRWMTRLLRP